MFLRYYMQSGMFSMAKYFTTHWSVICRERFKHFVISGNSIFKIRHDLNYIVKIFLYSNALPYISDQLLYHKFMTSDQPLAISVYKRCEQTCEAGSERDMVRKRDRHTILDTKIP